MTEHTTAAQASAQAPAATAGTASAGVRAVVTVDRSQAEAFELFTKHYGTWAPRELHIGPTDLKTVVVEPRAGGRWFEVGVDDAEWDWGRVLAWEPAGRVVLGWQINERWAFDPDADKASELEVRFIEEGPARTRVELEHRAFERHGPGGEGIRAAVSSPQGWPGVMELYAAAARA